MSDETSSSRKERLHQIIFESDTPAGKAFDIALQALIVLSVIAVILDSVSSISSQYGPQLRAFEWFVTITFTIEYILRLYCVGKPLKYAFSFYGIVDLLAILPTYLSLDIRRSPVAARDPSAASVAHLPNSQAGQLCRRGPTARRRAQGQRAKDRRLSRCCADHCNDHGSADVSRRRSEERIYQHTHLDLLDHRHHDDCGVRRHHSPNNARQVPRLDSHDHGLRDHCRADGYRDRRARRSQKKTGVGSGLSRVLRRKATT